jgi:hypothetical protein
MRLITVVSLFVCLSVNSTPIWACATCLCGDPTITTMGTEKPFAGRMRAGIEYLSRGEKAAEPGVNEFTVNEERVTLNFSYALNTEWMFAASLPMVTKEVERFDLSHARGSGIGDMDLSARWFLGRDDSFPVKYLWGMQFGLRVPTSTEQKKDGESIDIDAQPGVGATIPSLGVWYGRYALPWFFYTSASVQHALTDGYQNYQAGDVMLLTGLAQYALNMGVAVQLSLDGRFKKPDQYDGVEDPNSGGVLIMAKPGIAWTPLEDLVINLNYQIPVIENPNGIQEEDPTFRLGVAYDF